MAASPGLYKPSPFIRKTSLRTTRRKECWHHLLPAVRQRERRILLSTPDHRPRWKSVRVSNGLQRKKKKKKKSWSGYVLFTHKTRVRIPAWKQFVFFVLFFVGRVCGLNVPKTAFVQVPCSLVGSASVVQKGRRTPTSANVAGSIPHRQKLSWPQVGKLCSKSSPQLISFT